MFYRLIDKVIRRFGSDELFAQYFYYRKMNKRLNLSKPVSFNEKLQWLKINDVDECNSLLVDKIEVREFVRKKINSNVLIPIIGEYNSVEDIDWDSLPKRFVIKTTHNSGGVIVCEDKNKLVRSEVENKLNQHLMSNYYYQWRETPYKNVVPRIIIEEFIEEKSELGLIDYKFMCFHGKVEYIFVCTNRQRDEGLNIDIMTNEWKKTKFTRSGKDNSLIPVPKPKKLNEMISIAEKLSENKPFLRVDLYYINENPYFGELTFYPEAGFSGFEPEEFDLILGEKLRI